VELVGLRRQIGAPMIYVTHDQAEALSMGDRIVVLSAGRVLQTGTPEDIYRVPASPEVARQVGQPRINLLTLEPHGEHWRTKGGLVLLDRAVDQRGISLTLGVRPEDIRLEGGEHAAHVEVVENTGPAKIAILSWNGERLHVLLEKGARVRPGDTVYPRFDLTRATVWPSAAH
jgi:ABC-type sugar transport system ATPase subunit